MASQALPGAELGRDPVPGPEPAGENIRGEDDFVRLEDEMGKMQSAGPTAVDWPKVAGMASAILATRSKDLLVASWLCLALHRERGMPGLIAGLEVLRGIMEAHWEHCFPPVRRMRARIGAAEWVAARAGPSLADVTVSADNARTVLALFEAVDGLDRTLSEKADGRQADLGDLLRPLRRLKRDAEFVAAAEKEAATPLETAPDASSPASDPPARDVPDPPASAAPPVPAATPPSAPAPAAPLAPPPMEAVAPPAAAGPEMDRALNALRRNVIDMAKAVRGASPGDPRAYQLLRAVLWLPVRETPPEQGGRTMLPDPTGALGPVLSNLARNGSAPELVEFCEANAVDHLFWLDLHRHAAAALDALGHAAARDAVAGQTAAFLKRFPRIPELAFDSGTAFADAATRAWISAELAAGGQAGGAGTGTATEAAATGGTGADPHEARARALALAAKGKLGDAVAMLEGARDHAVGERSRFLWELEKARTCIDAGRSDLAMPLLTHLDKLAGEYSLDIWEPSVCVDLTVLLLRGGVADGEPEMKALRREWERRLSRLDMRAAIELAKSPAEGATG